MLVYNNLINYICQRFLSILHKIIDFAIAFRDTGAAIVAIFARIRWTNRKKITIITDRSKSARKCAKRIEKMRLIHEKILIAT